MGGKNLPQEMDTLPGLTVCGGQVCYTLHIAGFEVQDMAINTPLEQSISGEILATDVSFETYLERYAAYFCEWIDGTVIKMSPVHEDHDRLSTYLAILLEAYFEIKPIGKMRHDPFVMKLSAINVSREPDLQVILNTNPSKLTPTYMDGPADICIEIVSPESVKRDHGEKFEEYEKGGVPEYWIIDAIHRETRFYRLNEEGIYVRQVEDADGNYRTPNLPGLVLHVPTLWQDNLPGPMAVGKAVEAMLKDEDKPE
jgi:Uma2 family endonuclease